MVHHEVAALLQDFEPAVIGAADGDTVVAGRGLDPDVLKSGFAGDPPVRDAIQRNAAGHAEVLCTGGFAQPAGAGEQHVFGVVLRAPGQIFPVPHRGAFFPIAAVEDKRLLEVGGPVRHLKLAIVQFEQMLDLVAAAIGRQPHQFAALVPVAENVGGGAAVERAEPGHVVEFVAEEAAVRLHPYFFQALQRCAAERVVALGLARERRRRVAGGKGFHDVGAIAADAIDDHHDAILERRHRECAVGVRQMMGDRDHLVLTRHIQRVLGRVVALEFGKEARRIEIDQPLLHFLDRQDVAIAHHQIDVVERDALGIEAIVDHLLVESRRVLGPRDPLLGDRKRDGPIAQQAGADIMVIGVQAKDISVFFGHGTR